MGYFCSSSVTLPAVPKWLLQDLITARLFSGSLFLFSHACRYLVELLCFSRQAAELTIAVQSINTVAAQTKETFILKYLKKKKSENSTADPCRQRHVNTRPLGVLIHE